MPEHVVLHQPDVVLDADEFRRSEALPAREAQHEAGDQWDEHDDDETRPRPE